jgi:hypothetical protein
MAGSGIGGIESSYFAKAACYFHRSARKALVNMSNGDIPV